jgi:putative membrane protein
MNTVNRFPASRTPKEYMGLGARGFCMGCADVVPGVSGGTMAFILGIYEELVESIRVLGSMDFFRAVFRFDLKEVFRIFRWKFLGSVLAGIALAVLSLAKGLEWLLENHPVYIWSFFFGLVLASIITVSQRQKHWTFAAIVAILAGTIMAYIVVGMVPLQTPEAPWFLFLSGVLAICAMILPGISGSFVLVLLGKYQFVLGAVNDRDFVPIAIVGAGCVVGIISFAQVLSWLLKRYHDMTIALLVGLMVGSLRKIWPWKVTLETILDRHGIEVPVVQQNVLPPEWGGELLAAVVLAGFGFVVVLALDNMANRGENGGTEVEAV